MDSISTARDFFINQQGLSPDQADMIVSKGMEAYNQQSRPQPQPQQNMMQMASGGIARLGYQMGGSPMGVGAMPMDTGQSLQVPQQMPTNFSSAQSITSNPLLNYGQSQIGQAGGTPLSMNRGGIARLGYQMGGEAGIQQEQGMGQLGEGDNALLTIIQLLIEQGVDPQIAEKLARQILQVFAQGGEPALEAFADQLDQQEQAEAMAQGGVAGYAQRQGYFIGGALKSIGKAVSGVVKGVGKAIKSIAKSPIGKIALTVGATMLMGPAGLNLAVGQLGVTNAFLAGAINAGAANLLVQGITTGKFNPKEALLAGVLGGATGYMSPGTAGIDPNTGQAITSNASNITSNAAVDITTSPVSSASTARILSEPSFGGLGVNQIAPEVQFAAPSYSTIGGLGPTTIGGLGPTPSYTGLESNISSMTGTGYAAPKPNLPFQLQGAGDGSVINANAITSDYSYPGTLDKIKTSASNYGTDLMNKAQTGIQNLYQDPLGTIKKAAGSAFDYATDPENRGTIATVGGLTLLGSQLGIPRNEGEDDASYAKRLQDTQGYLTQYGRNLNITNPYFYQREGAVNPFAPTMAANGGIMGYAKGGSMVPPARQIEGGVIELDARKTGGYIPYGKKERVDDVPAMLAKDEFVFTSRAVKAAGNGSAKRGAKKMYALMKQLESKGARA
jgi:hypothetical protein